MGYIFVCILLLLFVLVLYKWSVSKYDVFTKRGVPHVKPYPLLGNVPIRGLFGNLAFLEQMIEQHLKFKECKVYGVYAMRDAMYFVRDAELIKTIAINAFEHFVNHKAMHNNLQESILSNSLFSLKDGQWRRTRRALTQSFTGSKIRAMHELINACSLNMVKYIERVQSKNSDFELEMKDCTTRFANDVIATVAFGLQVSSFEQPNNEFYTMGQSLTQFEAIDMLKAVLLSIMPKIMQKLHITMFNPKDINYFNSLLSNVIKYRRQHGVKRADMVQLLMQAQQYSGIPEETALSDDELFAQCLLFFFAGFETIATALCFTTYELCMNSKVQAKLFQEIVAVDQQLQSKPLDYDTLIGLPYLDMVISESLRKWPPGISTDRECSRDFDLVDENKELVLSLKSGDTVQIPIFAIHHDAENYPEPELFKPERFASDQRHNIKPFTYLPFGLGPRQCIGNRLALMELKSFIYHLVLKFELLPAPKTARNMLQSIVGYRLQPKELFWLKLAPRGIR